jgi:hypothetical protein
MSTNVNGNEVLILSPQPISGAFWSLPLDHGPTGKLAVLN